MTKYVITARHKPEQCMQALDEELAKGKDVLGKFVYGCKDSDHTGYAIVEAANKSEALSLVPGFLQDDACVTKVESFTPEDIRAFHKLAA